jgi:hypothetical protein
VVAHDDDGSIGVEFGVGAGGDIAHGHEERVGEAGCFVLPGFADVQEEGRVGLAAFLREGFDGDFGFQHEFKDILIEAQEPEGG